MASNHFELMGGKSPRQRIWDAIRAMNGKLFDVRDVTPGDVQTVGVRDYLVGLALAGYLKVVNQGKAPRDASIYQLARDAGAEAPRVRKNGEEISGNGNEAMWGAMQALGSFTTRVLAKMSGAKEATVKSYCRALEKAGYLTVERAAKAGVQMQYRLLKSRVQGPRPPHVTRLKAVYDPNIHAIVWQQNADDVVEGEDK
jgi:hypothetical protein